MSERVVVATDDMALSREVGYFALVWFFFWYTLQTVCHGQSQIANRCGVSAVGGPQWNECIMERNMVTLSRRGNWAGSRED